MQNVGNIGQDKAIQNPQDAIVQEQGAYKDPVESLSQDARLPLAQIPQGPQPNPFGNLSSPTKGGG